MESVIVREYERVYKIVCRTVNKQNYKVEYNKLINLKSFRFKNEKDESQMFIKAGKVLAILTTLDITEVFFKGIVIRKDELIIDFRFININKKDKLNNTIMSSLDICNKILNCLCYREEYLYKESTCSNFIKSLKDGWEPYGRLFMYSYRHTYRLINSNKILFRNIAQSKVGIKLNVMSNLYRLNKYDLSIKSSIIEIEFDIRKNKSFKLECKQLNKTVCTNDLIEELEKISDRITQKSILGIKNSNICRSFIGYKISKNNEIIFDILDFDYKNGVMGIVYFYLKLFELTQNKYYFKLARESINGYGLDVNNISNEIIFILKYMYELSGKEEYKNIYLKNKLSDIEVKTEELKLKNTSSYSCMVFKNRLDNYFLGIDKGLAGYGLYIINLIHCNENVVNKSNNNI